MRKLAAFIIIFAIWYFAGMNFQPNLLTVSVCLAAVVIISFIFSRIIRNKLDVYIPPQENLAYKNTENSLKLTAENKSSFPVNRFAAKIEMKYKTDSKGTIKKLSGSAAGKNDGNTEAEFYFSAPYCGLIEANIKKIRVYDYFGFFSNSKKLRHEKHDIFIVPQTKDMKILMPPYGTYTSHPVADSSSNSSGDDHSEIRLLREYRDGDLIRHIHKNMTAKTQKLWIKENNKENDYIFDLILNTSDAAITTELLDSLYEIVFAVLGTLIKNEVTVKLHWYDKNVNGMRNADISDQETLLKIVPDLYRSDMNCTADEFYYASGNHDNENMMINSKLEWYFGKKHIYSFNKDNIENDLICNVFDLRR